MPYSELDIILHPEKYLPNIQVDNVIFGYHEKELKVLLHQTIVTSKWTITGGYVGREESVEEAASRIAWSRTGLKNLFLQQFRSFGAVNRSEDIEKNAGNLSKLAGIPVAKDLWIFHRFVSLAFYTLTEFSTVEIKKWALDADCRWWPVNELPPLMFDHKQIITEALRALRMHIAFFPIGYELLPEKFTIPQLQALYEGVYDTTFDDRNFSRKLLSTGLLVKLHEKDKFSSKKGAFYYKLDQSHYAENFTRFLNLVPNPDKFF